MAGRDAFNRVGQFFVFFSARVVARLSCFRCPRRSPRGKKKIPIAIPSSRGPADCVSGARRLRSERRYGPVGVRASPHLLISSTACPYRGSRRVFIILVLSRCPEWPAPTCATESVTVVDYPRLVKHSRSAVAIYERVRCKHSSSETCRPHACLRHFSRLLLYHMRSVF